MHWDTHVLQHSELGSGLTFALHSRQLAIMLCSFTPADVTLMQLPRGLCKSSLFLHILNECRQCVQGHLWIFGLQMCMKLTCDRVHSHSDPCLNLVTLILEGRLGRLYSYWDKVSHCGPAPLTWHCYFAFMWRKGEKNTCSAGVCSSHRSGTGNIHLHNKGFN